MDTDTDPVIDYRAMQPGDILAALGDDARKWADAYCQIWPAGCADRECMIGWFANAIEHSNDVRRWKREALSPRPDGGEPRSGSSEGSAAGIGADEQRPSRGARSADASAPAPSPMTGEGDPVLVLKSDLADVLCYVGVRGEHPENEGRQRYEAAAKRLHAALSTPPPAGAVLERADVERFADAVVQRICDFDDRTSPEDWPEALLVTGSELIEVMVTEFEDGKSLKAPLALAAPAVPEGIDEGVLQEALSRAIDDMNGLCPEMPVSLVNMLGRHMVHHIKDVQAEFAAPAPSTAEGG